MSQTDIQQIIAEIRKNRSDQEIVHAQMRLDMQALKLQNDEMYAIFQKGSGFIYFLKIIGMVAIALGGFLVTIKQLK